MKIETKRLSQLMEAGIESLDITITIEDIVNQDISAQMAILSALLDNEDFAIYFREKVNIVFTGINPGDKNLWEIPEVRKYIQKLDDEFPYWLYFLSKESGDLNLIYECRMIPFLNNEDEFDLNFAEFKDSVQNRWMPALNEVCAYTDMSDEETQQMCMSFYRYMLKK